MIDYNFEEAINKIFGQIPEEIEKSLDEEQVQDQERQMIDGVRNYKTFHMFSATMQPYVEKLARDYLRFPAFIQVATQVGADQTHNIEQRVEFVNSGASRMQKLK